MADRADESPGRLPAPVAGLAAALADVPGVVAVVLGGSRASASHGPESDWDLGVYYRGSRRPLDPGDVGRLGHLSQVSRLGEWGPIVNGGAWLTVDGVPVDVLFRDLDEVERWLSEAEQGRFEVLRQNGYLVGAPTYLPVGELALCRPISGRLPRPDFPRPLAQSAGGEPARAGGRRTHVRAEPRTGGRRRLLRRDARRRRPLHRACAPRGASRMGAQREAPRPAPGPRSGAGTPRASRRDLRRALRHGRRRRCGAGGRAAQGSMMPGGAGGIRMTWDHLRR